jgi:hypothetical protein
MTGGEYDLGLLVMGMHRSGTSATTAALAAVTNGTEIPSDDFPPCDDNARGYSESMCLTTVNAILLEALGGAWDTLPEFTPDWVDQLFDTQAPQFAQVNFDKTFTTDAWIWKDPRTCLTAPFWLRLLKDRIDGIVIVFRHPEEVAASMASSRPISYWGALDLWSAYTRAAIHSAIGYRTLITSYHSLLDSPDTWLAQVGDLIDSTPLHLVANPARALMGVASPALRRHARVPGGRRVLPQQASALFAELMDLEGVHQHLSWRTADLLPSWR